MSQVEEIHALVDRVVERFEKIDILVNCVGISKLTRVPDITPQEWDLVLGVRSPIRNQRQLRLPGANPDPSDR